MLFNKHIDPRGCAPPGCSGILMRYLVSNVMINIRASDLIAGLVGSTTESSRYGCDMTMTFLLGSRILT